PAQAYPVRVEVGEAGQLQLGDPLGGRDIAVEPRYDHADREAVLDGQRLAVHADSQQRVPAVQQHRGGRADGEPVDRPTHHLVGAVLDAGRLQHALQRYPQPLRVAYQVAADVVGDAGEGDVALHHRHREQLRVGDGGRVVHPAVDAQLP